MVSVTLLFTAAPLVPYNAAIGAASGTAVLAVLAWYKRCRAAAPLSIFCVICLGLVLSGVRYFPLVLGLSLLSYAGGRARCTLAAGNSHMWLLAAAALFSWYLLLRPNVADIVETFVPDQPLGLLIAGGLIFSMLNAAVEEGAYRGVILHALDRSLGPGFAALLLQALAFGAIHIRGFPRGWLGVGLACIYGLLMGVIRRRAGGMFAPWITHVFTDVVIAGIVVLLARPNQALQPTAGRRTPQFFMTPTSHSPATRALASGGSAPCR